MSLVLITTTTSCNKSCGDNCLHGTCDNGSCNCPDPYSGNNCDTMCTLGLEGYMCQTPSSEKFFGTWNCTSTDQSGNSKTYLITFTANSYNLFMDMNNFDQVGGYPIICTMVGKESFSIDQTEQTPQGTAAGISGSGQFNNGTLIINVSENGGVSFFAKATRQ